MSYYISKDPDYGLVFEDALFYSFGLRMPMPKLIFTEHASPITDHRSRITKYVTHERQNCFRCWIRVCWLTKTFLQAKTFTKNVYAIFCFAKRNISLVKLSLNPLEKRLRKSLRKKKGLMIRGSAQCSESYE